MGETESYEFRAILNCPPRTPLSARKDNGLSLSRHHPDHFWRSPRRFRRSTKTFRRSKTVRQSQSIENHGISARHEHPLGVSATAASDCSSHCASLGTARLYEHHRG